VPSLWRCADYSAGVIKYGHEGDTDVTSKHLSLNECNIRAYIVNKFEIHSRRT